MTLIFSGNDFKYELEGVMKLFIPAKLFKHEFTDSYVTVEGSFAFFRRKRGKKILCFMFMLNWVKKTVIKLNC